MNSIESCLDIWNVYHKILKMGVEKRDETQPLVNFVQEFFSFRDKRFHYHTRPNGYDRIETDDDQTLFNFTKQEFAETFCWCYPSKDMAEFLKGYMKLDKDGIPESGQGEIGINQLAVQDDYFNYIYAIKICDEETYVDLESPYTVDRYVSEPGEYYRMDGTSDIRIMRKFAFTEEVTQRKIYVDRIAFLSDSLSSEQMFELIPKKHMILSKRVDESGYMLYCDVPLWYEENNGHKQYGHIYSAKDMSLNIGPSIKFTRAGHLDQLMDTFRAKHPRVLILLPRDECFQNNIEKPYRGPKIISLDHESIIQHYS